MPKEKSKNKSSSSKNRSSSSKNKSKNRSSSSENTQSSQESGESVVKGIYTRKFKGLYHNIVFNSNSGYDIEITEYEKYPVYEAKRPGYSRLTPGADKEFVEDLRKKKIFKPKDFDVVGCVGLKTGSGIEITVVFYYKGAEARLKELYSRRQYSKSKLETDDYKWPVLLSLPFIRKVMPEKEGEALKFFAQTELGGLGESGELGKKKIHKR